MSTLKAKKLATTRRRSLATQAWLAGATLEKAAEVAGYKDRSGAHKGIREYITENTNTDLREAQAKVLLRHEAIIKAHWIEALTPAPSGKANDSAKIVQKSLNEVSNLLGLNHSDRLAERAQALDELQFTLTAKLLAGVMDDLGMTVEDRKRADASLQRQLIEIESGAAS